MSDQHNSFVFRKNFPPQVLHLVANLRFQPALPQLRMRVVRTAWTFGVGRVADPFHHQPRPLPRHRGKLLVELDATGIPRNYDEAAI